MKPDFSELVERFSRQLDIESQLILMFDIFGRLFKCVTKVWLPDDYSKLVHIETLQDQQISLSERTDLMRQAYATLDLAQQYLQGEANEKPVCIAIPLIAGHNVLGVIELDRHTKQGFSHQEIDQATRISHLSALGIDWQIQKRLNTE
ncbi:MAG: hypothetical protein ACM3H7_03615, partial [Acidobacteriaceae bacterium]